MSELAKIEHYISLTKLNMKRRDLYCMRLSELHTLCEVSDTGILNAICMAFDYGMAKGYRMAKREARK